MYLMSDKKDSLRVTFGLIDQTRTGSGLAIRVEARVSGYAHEADYWVTEADFRRFVEKLQQLSVALVVGEASIEGENSKNSFALSIQSDPKYRGYLFIRTAIDHQVGYVGFLTARNHFDGGFYSEPANLPEWLEELTGILEKAV